MFRPFDVPSFPQNRVLENRLPLELTSLSHPSWEKCRALGWPSSPNVIVSNSPLIPGTLLWLIASISMTCPARTYPMYPHLKEGCRCWCKTSSLPTAWKRDFRRKNGLETTAAMDPDTAPSSTDESHWLVECPPGEGDSFSAWDPHRAHLNPMWNDMFQASPHPNSSPPCFMPKNCFRDP